MTSVTVSRGSDSVTFDVYERAGNLMIARDAGKPNARIYRVGGADPKASDHRAPIESYTVVGQLVGPGAYADARTLAEDIVKPEAGGASATLDLSAVTGLSSKQVGFIGPAPVRLGYPPGQGEWVSLQLTAVVVDNTIGGTTTGEGGTPGTGSGPVRLTNGGTSIVLEKNLDVERKVGRPDNTTRHDADDEPYLVDRPRSSNDVFELSGVWTTSAASKQNTLIDQIIKPRLGFGTLTLDFNGVYGLGSYNVVAVDTQSARVSWTAGEAGMVRVERLKLTVADSV